MDGFFLIDKESGMTSFDIVKKVRQICGGGKVGHAGTLDPLATGLLIVAIGEGTKLLEYLIGCDKEYEVTAHFGYVSDTFDAEGNIVECDKEIEVSEDELKKHISEKFLGEITQIPPKYSALKIKGKKACDRIRDGEDFEMKGRTINVNSFEIIKYDWPFVSFKIKCGTGTYIRSLIYDLGEAVKCGAYVKDLRRICVNSFFVQGAVQIFDLIKKPQQYLFPLEDLVQNFRSIDLTEKILQGIEDGKIYKEMLFETDSPVMGLYEGKLIGVLENNKDKTGIKYRKKFLNFT